MDLLSSKAPLPRRNVPAPINNEAIADYALLHYRSGTTSSSADATAPSGIRHTRGSLAPNPGLGSDEHRLKRQKIHDLDGQSLLAKPDAEPQSRKPIPLMQHSEQKLGPTITTITQGSVPSSTRPWVSPSPNTSNSIKPPIELEAPALALRPSQSTGNQRTPIPTGEHKSIRRDLSVATKSEQYTDFRHAQLRTSSNEAEAEASRTVQGSARPSSQISDGHENKSATSSLGPSIPLLMVELPRRNPFL